MDDMIDEIALTLLDHGYDQIGFRQIVDQICAKMEEYEEYREDERTRRDMEEAAQAEMDRADYMRKRALEDRYYETDWIEMSERF